MGLALFLSQNREVRRKGGERRGDREKRKGEERGGGKERDSNGVTSKGGGCSCKTGNQERPGKDLVPWQ